MRIFQIVLKILKIEIENDLNIALIPMVPNVKLFIRTYYIVCTQLIYLFMDIAVRLKTEAATVQIAMKLLKAQ